MVWIRWSFILFVAALAGTARAQSTDPAGIEFFESKIRPLLAERCYKCHSDSAEKLKGGLHLDSPAGILAGGGSGAIIVPAAPEKSRLLIAVGYENPELQMPPKGKLPDADIAILKKWVQLDAPMPKGGDAPVASAKAFDLEKRRASHWAWQPVKAIDPPAVANPAWSKSPIDRFIFAKLAAKNLSPAVPAEKRSLIRRAYFDLIGLPPSPADVQAFLDDKSQDAFEKLVDRLLASEHFGERWGRHWLDLARYAETYGHEFDFPIANAEEYLRYVVRAFNADLPYDQFVTEQIAGDLIPNPRLNPKDAFNESIIGTGFWFLGEQTHAPVDVRQHQADRIDNQIEVFSKTFLGLTLNCARCHDHKFDAISAKDYYSMFGILESTTIQQAYLDPHEKIATAVKTIEAARSEGSQLLLSKLPEPKKAGETLAAYLMASREVGMGPAAAATQEIVFEDFEKPTYEGWEVEGTAFGTGPQTQKTIAPYQGDVGAAGKGFVNSHNIHAGEDMSGGDQHLGKMTSRPFTIERRFIRFLIGGGAHDGRTCLNVLIDGKLVRTAKGRNDNHMLPAELDVAEFRGKTARIEIVDAEPGPWGNIGVDQIVFADGGGANKATVAASPAEIERVAAEKKLDAKVLARVVELTRGDSIKDPAHPLYAWNKLSASTGDSKISAEKFDALRSEAKGITEARSKTKTFDAGGAVKWFASGDAFGPAGAWDALSKSPRLAAAPGVADSRAIDRRLRGVMRSPSFVLENKRIFYRVAGQNAQLKLVIDGYFMDSFSGLLFEGLIVPVNTRDGGFEWHEQGLERYFGHRAHIELIDDSDGWIALDEVRFGDGGPVREAAPMLEHLTSGQASGDIETLTRRYADVLADALTGLRSGKANASQVSLANWCIDAGILLDADASKALQASLAGLVAKVNSTPVVQPRRVLAAADGNGVDEHIFLRGSPKTLGEVAPRRFLEAIAGPQKPAFKADGSGRLELAKRVVDPANPLTSRVMANRVWHHLLGRGIVASTDDFGVMGQTPTHPELLDFLADQFVHADGWSVKKLIRSIMLSQTYQMSSTPDARAAQVDANNELLQHARIRRLEGEVIRDSILAVSGRLDPKIEGPFVEVALTPFMEGRGKPASGPVDGAGRRSIYLHVRRNFLSPMMQAFDMPIPFSTMGRRSVSNVPAQALILLNDPFVTEQCQRWAKATLEEKGLSSSARIERMYQTAFSRPPTEQEVGEALEFLLDQSKELGLPPAAADSDPRVWSDLAHVLVNVKEFIFLN